MVAAEEERNAYKYSHSMSKQSGDSGPHRIAEHAVPDRGTSDRGSTLNPTQNPKPRMRTNTL